MQPILWIPDWDFNWQDRYTYKSPVLLPKGTKIVVSLLYDNSADNHRNPSSPPKRVTWGEESFDEMGAVTLAVQAVRKEDEPVLQQFIAARVKAAIAQAMRDGTLRRFQEHQQGGAAPRGQ
jgi:hypothetical protein